MKFIGNVNWKFIQPATTVWSKWWHGQATVKGGNRGQSSGLRDEILAASMLVIEGGWFPPAAGGSARKSSRKVDLGAVLLGRADNGC